MNSAILAELSKTGTLQDTERTLNLLAQVEELLSRNCMGLEECVPLVKLTVTNNCQIKSVVWDIMVRVAAEVPDVHLMFIASLNKDVSDPNPGVRSIGISTFCSIHGLEGYSVKPVLAGLEDAAPTVRISAVTGIGKLYKHSKETIQEYGLIDKLYSMIRDQDPTVVTFSLQTLNYVLEQEGGLVMPRSMVTYLLSRIPTYPEREFCCVLEYMDKSSRVVESVVEMLNALDSFLENKNPSVVLAVSKLLVNIVHTHTGLQSSLVLRLCPVLEKLIKSAKRDLQTDLLRFTLTLHKQYFAHFSRQEKFINLRSRDTEELKEIKIRFICLTANSKNCLETMNCLLNLLPLSERLNRTILSSVCTIARLDESAHESCIKNMRLLVKTDKNLYLNLVLQSDLRLEDFKEKDSGIVTSLVETILEHFRPDTYPNPVLNSVLCLLENYGSMYKMSPYILEQIFNTDRTEWDEDLYSDALAAGFSLFAHFPAAMQPILSNIFHKTLKIRNHHLNSKTVTYYNLLKQMASGS
jgi:hypothetical protein